MSRYLPTATGWQPDLADFRDFALDHPEISPLMERLSLHGSKDTLPPTVDLRDEGDWLTDDCAQASSACCAFAVLDLVEHLERKLLGRTLKGSKLFLLQLALRLAGWPADVDVSRSNGVALRTTLKTLVRFGAPPERFWPFDEQHCSRPPLDPLLFSFDRDYRSLRYFRLDPPGTSPSQLLNDVRRLLALGLPCVCGFSVPRSLTKTDRIPPANGRDELVAGQAVLVLGYDERPSRPPRKKQPQRGRSKVSRRLSGALLIRCYWGKGWGDRGDGWLPYQYVEQSLASSFWGVVKPEWVAEAY